jgi:hypothetical protein
MDIPTFYQQLLSAPGVATLSVLSVDGSIQSTLVWNDFDGQFIKISMNAGTPKERSLRREKTATVLRSHPSNENLYISLRCELHEIREHGAIEYLDMMTQRNMNLATWYGNVEPEEKREKDKNVLVYLKPVRIYHT